MDPDEYVPLVNLSEMTMPASPMQLYAVYRPIYYLIQIDPNGGQFEYESDNYSTWFYKTYNQTFFEYDRTTRNYIESPRGDYYYRYASRDYYGLGNTWSAVEDGISERDAYYTQDISKATDLSVRYEYSPNAYRYAGWYVVDADGTESLYNFSAPVQSDLYLRLHWKALMTYYIRYDPNGGVMDENDSNEQEFKILDDADYADNAWVVVGRTIAAPPEDKNFIGWRIKGDSTGKLYFPGHAFAFNGSLAEIETTDDGKTKRYMTMEAVYQSLDTPSIIYNANGGSLALTADSGDGHFLENVIYDAGGKVTGTTPLSDAEKYEYNQDAGTLTVFNLMNNTKVTLSSGEGFTYEKNGVTYEFAGWNTKPDGSGDHYDMGSDLYYIDTEDDNPITLYAEWKIRVYFDKNNSDATWGGDWTTDGYLYDADADRYYKEIYLNSVLSEPQFIPISSNTNEEMFQFWSTTRYTVVTDNTPFDFSQPITQELIEETGNSQLVLYAIYDAPIKLPVHVVDSSNETLENKDSTWRLQENLIINSDTDIDIGTESIARTYADPQAENYKFAFACVSDSLDNVAEENSILDVYYDQSARHVYVTYADGRKEPIPENMEVYLVYYTYPSVEPIGYVKMETNGALEDLRDAGKIRSGTPTEAAVDSAYEMAEHLTTPLTYPTTPYQYYSYAIGSPNAASSADLRIITAPSDSNGSRPSLQVKDTWRGFQYSVDGGSTWVNAGYDIELYVVYYDTQPTVVNLHEKTIGFEEDMTKKFTYSVDITEQTKTITGREYYYYSNQEFHKLDPGNYDIYYQQNNGSYKKYNYQLNVPQLNDDTLDSYSILPEPLSIALSDGEQESFTLFYTETDNSSAGYNGYGVGNYGQLYYRISVGNSNNHYPIYYKDINKQITTQTITIVQEKDDNFSIEIEKEPNAGTVSGYQYTYISPPNSTTQKVTYINQRTPIPLEVHVALMVGGEAKKHDNYRSDAFRTGNTGLKVYQHMIELDDTLDLAEAFDENALLDRADKDDYVFAGVFYGKTDADGVTVQVQGKDIRTVNYTTAEGNDQIYELYLNNNREMQLNGYELYYVYYKRPAITYWYADSAGNLTKIEPLTRNQTAVTLNGGTVTQDAKLYVDGTNYKKNGSFVLDQSDSSLYWVPPNLDYQGESLAIDYTYIGVGDGTTTKLSDLQGYSTSKQLWLDAEDGVLQYRLHETDVPKAFSSDPPVVYVIYKGSNELTTKKTLSSMNYEKGIPTFQFRVTQIEDADGNTVDASDAVQYVVSLTFNSAGTRTAVLTDLPPGKYKVEELSHINYEAAAGTNTQYEVTLQNATHAQCEFKNNYTDSEKKTYQTFADNKITYTN